MSGVSSEGGGSNQDVDLNIVPIIDCFTVLIAYLLLSASFLSLGAFDVGVSVTGEATDQQLPAKPPYQLFIHLNPENKVTVKLMGGPENISEQFSVAQSSKREISVADVQSRLNEIKKRTGEIENVSLTTDLSVRYKNIVRLIEETHDIFPKIYLSADSTAQVADGETDK